MNNKYIKLIIIFLLTFVFACDIKADSINKYINETTKYKVIIEDDVNLLTEEEINKLLDDMKPLTEYGNIAFKSISNNSTTTKAYASKYYKEKFGTSSGTLFLIDMDNRYIYIFSDGFNYKIITNNKAEIITDNVYKYASNKKYYECASKAFKQVNTLLNGGKIMEPMRYISNIFIAFTISFFINFLIVLFATKIKKAKTKEIIKNCDVKFDISNISAIKTGQHRVYSPIESSSSGGGGSSGGGFSGGGSSGGGGGHRF